VITALALILFPQAAGGELNPLDIPPAGASASAPRVASDGAGNVVVTGGSYNADGNIDYYTVKYAANDGAPLWEQRYNGPANRHDRRNFGIVWNGALITVLPCPGAALPALGVVAESCVEAVEEDAITVHHLEAIDGTPVLDIKPNLSNIPESDLRRGWMDEAEARRAAQQ